MDAPGAGSTVLFKQLHVSSSVIHVLALTNAFSTQTLTTFSLSLDAPIPLGDFTQIPSIVTAPSDACIAASKEDGGARVVWFEEGRMRSTLVKADGSLGATKDLLPGKGRKYAKILHTGSRQWGYVMGQQRDGTVDIIDVSEGAKIVDTFESSVCLHRTIREDVLRTQADNADRSQSTYATVKAKDGVVFNRVYWSFSMNVSKYNRILTDFQLAACQTYIVSRTDNQVINSGFTFPFDIVTHGLFLHVSTGITETTYTDPDKGRSIDQGQQQPARHDSRQYLHRRFAAYPERWSTVDPRGRFERYCCRPLRRPRRARGGTCWTHHRGGKFRWQAVASSA
jgi:hypothetical protein